MKNLKFDGKIIRRWEFEKRTCNRWKWGNSAANGAEAPLGDFCAVNVISSAMIASAGSDDGLSKSGWMAALWGAEVVLTVLILAFIGMYVWKTVMSKRAKPDDGGHVNESV